MKRDNVAKQKEGTSEEVLPAGEQEPLREEEEQDSQQDETHYVSHEDDDDNELQFTVSQGDSIIDMFLARCATEYNLQPNRLDDFATQAKAVFKKDDRQAICYSKAHVSRIIEALTTKSADASQRKLG